MTQGERVKELRKTLSLTLEKFGQRIGVGKSTVSDLENGRRSFSEHMTKSICREFSVDYMWLTTGEDEARKNLFKFMLELSDEDIVALDRLMKKAIEFTQNNKEKD